MNLSDILQRQAQAQPAATAVILPERSIRYGELDAHVWKMAALLRANGVAPGDVVAINFGSEYGIVVSMLATARIGATVFSLPPSWPETLRGERAARAGVRFLVSDLGKKRNDPFQRIDLSIAELEVMPIPPNDSIIGDPRPQAPWLILFGSGTTGQPKMMPITHAQQLARCGSAREWYGLAATDRVCSLTHFDYSSTKTRFLEAMAGGAPFFIPDRKRGDIPAQCKTAGVTVLHGTTFHLEQLMALPQAPEHKLLEFLRVLTVGSSTITDEFRKRVAGRLCPRLHIHYGTNETGLLTYSQPPLAFSLPGTVGQRLAETEIEIVDDQGNRLAPGKVGQVRARRPGMIDGYLGNDEETRAAFRNGWFVTGDLAQLTVEGQLIYFGRSDHMMIMNGINIYPAEIERVLNRHPDVRDCAAVPLHSPIHQDVPVCAVVLWPDARATERDLLRFAHERLGAHALHKVVLVEKIPYNEQGKLQRKELMQLLGQRQQAQDKRPEPAGLVRQSGDRNQTSGSPVIRFTWALDLPGPIDLRLIDAWLDTLIDNYSKPDTAAKTGMPAPWAAISSRGLALANTLLQAGRMPVFAPGRVLETRSIRHNPPAWQATVELPAIDHVSARAYQVALDAASRAMRLIASRALTTENRVLLFTTLDKEAVQPIRQMMRTGKSTLPILRAAHALDIPFIHLGAGVFQLGWACRSRRIDRSTTGSDSAIGSKLAQNKAWSANLLRLAGLPAPQHSLVTTEEQALEAASALGWPLVVKPIDRDRGEGVTVDIRSQGQLLAALKYAKGPSRTRKVIVERAVGGVCHRLFIARGRLLYAVKRLPKSVHGDGERSVAALIAAANLGESALPPWRRTERYPDDALALEAMAAAGYTPESIPAPGERVPLRHIESTAAGGHDEDVTLAVHPDNLDAAIRAAALFDLEIAGIDIITPDIGRPWHENGAIINEVNYAPLLGGGPISRSYLADYLGRLIEVDGRIPIEVFVGNDAAFQLAFQRQKELAAGNIACYLSSHASTLTPAGTDMPMPTTSLRERCQALLMNRQVEAIVLVAQTDELLRSGLPMDRIDRIMVGGNSLLQSRQSNGFEQLRQLLGQYIGRHVSL